jgi:hypothetical protein
MESEVSLPCSQEPATGSYPELDESSPHLPTLFSKIHSNGIFQSLSISSEWSLPFRCFEKVLYALPIRTVRATYPALNIQNYPNNLN